MIRKFKLKKWYPGVPEEYKTKELTASSTPSCWQDCYVSPCSTLFSKSTIENNPEYWTEIDLYDYKDLKDKNGEIIQFTCVRDGRIFRIGDEVNYVGASGDRLMIAELKFCNNDNKLYIRYAGDTKLYDDWGNLEHYIYFQVVDSTGTFSTGHGCLTADASIASWNIR